MRGEDSTSSAEGHELRRPEADFLRDGIYELLYFFHGQNVAVLAHGLTKEAEAPEQLIIKDLPLVLSILSWVTVSALVLLINS